MNNLLMCFRKTMVVVLLFALAGATALLGQGRQRRQRQPAPQQQPGAKPEAPPVAPAAPNYEALLANLRWREIGPAIMGGRIDDFAVVESDPNIVYVGVASGGVWKTTNSGTTWTPIFDDQPVSTIGDVTVAPSDPSIVWVGTGEPNNRQSSSWGNGVYKSTDAGRTWQNMGLKDTHHIARIIIHPANPNVVYVAAVGHLWGPNKERGLYKTTDGGKTWQQVLFINEDTGVIDVAMDLESPDTLYAAAYQRRRTVFGFNGSGPGSMLYKTTDGGTSWKKLMNGLPYNPEWQPPVQVTGGGPGGGGGGAGAAAQLAAAQQQAARPREPKAIQETGRIGVSIYRRNSNIVYAIIEHADGGVFRSEDKGETWTRMSDTNPRPMYYSQIVIDPNNDLRIWVMGAPMYYSEDGGRTFRTNRVSRIHGDYHAMWINPADSNHMIVGSDGGIHWSRDAGQTWDFVNTLALGQFYEIGVDMQKPYRVCGGLQDNGSWCAPAQTLYARGISNDEWVNVAGGDGYYVQIDPTDPNIVYAESQDGNPIRRNLATSESKSIRPREDEGEERYRFQWNTPIVISVHDPKVIYYAAQYVFKSTDRGDTWTKISPDLTTGTKRDEQPIMGKAPDRYTRSRHDGVQAWPTISALSESPLNRDVLWAGTDDGRLQITRDGGKTWTDVMGKVPGIQSKLIYVSRVVASRHAEGRAYLALDGHRMNDYNIYVYATEDFGQTWKPIRSGIPDDKGVINVIREHHRNPNLLFAGGEYGAYVSFDRGANWSRLRMNVPTVPVDDILIHPRENDLLFGTHGRSIWVLDDITPLEQLTPQVLESDVHLFDIRPATNWRIWNHKASTGHKIFVGPNPPLGALIHFYLKSALKEEEQIRITVQDKEGKTITTINCGGRARRAVAQQAAQLAAGFGFAVPAAAACDPKPGINRVVWNLRTQPAPGAAVGGGPGFGFGVGLGQGSRVDPGEFTVKLTMGSKELTKKVVVEEDPRVQISDADRAARRKAINDLTELQLQATQAQRQITGLRTAVQNALNSWRAPGMRVPDNVRQAAEDLLKKSQEVCEKLATRQQCGTAPAEQLGSAGPPLQPQPPTFGQRIGVVLGQLENWTAAPNSWQLGEITKISGPLRDAAAQVRKLATEDLAALNKLANEAGVPHIRVAPAAGEPGGPPTDDAVDLP